MIHLEDIHGPLTHDPGHFHPRRLMPPTADLAKRFLDAAARASGLRSPGLYSRRRDARTCRLRWAVWVALREFGLTYMEIGDVFGKDHGTIIHGCRRAADLTGRDLTDFTRAHQAAADSIKGEPWAKPLPLPDHC